MKKYFFLLILCNLAMCCFTANAQYYCVYDGSDFNILIIYSNENKVTDISVSNKNKTEWVKLTMVELLDFEQIEDYEEVEGFWCKVKDVNNTTFDIMYFFATDAVLVTNKISGSSWKLYRRKKI